MPPRRAMVLVMAAPALAAAFLAAGCGGDDSGSGGGGAYGGSPQPTTTAAQPATTAPAAAGTSVAGKNAFTMDLQDDQFAPSALTGTPGQKLTITLKNVGTQEHNFSLEEQGVDTDVESGETATVTVTFPKSGTLGFFCEYHKSLGMTGTLAASPS